MIIPPLQIGWFIDYVPGWLSPTLLYIGGVLTMISGWGKWDPTQSTDLHFLVHIGIGILAIPAFQQHPRIIAVLLTLAGSLVEGVLAIRIYMKIRHVLVNKQLPPGSLKNKIIYHLTAFFVAALIIWGIVFLSLSGQLGSQPLYELALIWTLITVFSSIIVLGWKLKDSFTYFPGLHIIGLILLIAGSGIFNFRFLFESVFLYGLSGAVYAIGFWSGIRMYINRMRNPEIAVTIE